MTTLLTINTRNLYRTDQPADQARYARIEELIRQVDADIIAVQEIVAEGPDVTTKRRGAQAGLRRLAAAVDRRCNSGGQPAVAVGGGSHHTGLLWRHDIEPVAGSRYTLTRESAGMWHSAVSVVLNLDGTQVRVGSAHLPPFDMNWAVMDTNQLLRMFHRDPVPGLLGGDFNSLSADPVYDPNPYPGQPWHPDHVYQLADTGEVDRRPAHRLEVLGRMRDCARLAGAPWQPTTGHFPSDHHPPRRIDRWYATHQVPVEAISGYTVIDAATVADATDHLPVLITVDPARIALTTTTDASPGPTFPPGPGAPSAPWLRIAGQTAHQLGSPRPIPDQDR